MAFVAVYSPASLGFVAPPLRELVVNATRDGEETSDYKEAVLWASVHDRRPLVFFSLRDGLTATERVVASAVDGIRAVMLYDFDAKPYAAVRTPDIAGDVVFAIDLNDGTGSSGPSGDPALVPAVVRVDSQIQSREIVAVEKTTTGEWRVAGFEEIGSDDLNMRVSGGLVYALGLDDYGMPYQSGLAVTVGQRIRPSTFRGWLYDVTEAGTLPEAEPDWWPIEGDNPPRLVGTARLQAVRYYRPLAHGPITVEMT